MSAVDINVLPGAGTGFRVALGIHIAAGLTCVVSGAIAATARKRPGRHPRAGRIYLWGLSAVVVSATAMAVLRWPRDVHLLAIAIVAGALAVIGWRARRRRWRRWVRWHATGVGGSYIALLTGFYVDNGPRLPLWDRLPTWAFWVLPTLIGAPLITLALRRFSRPRAERPRATARRVGRRSSPS
jgi:peptidoglycan/LPS O-acetylase OafA/YrhL